jgi:uncharacterized protein
MLGVVLHLTYYWTAKRGSAEVDFIVDTGCAIIPVEVKAEVNLQAKSLKTYREKFTPPLSIRTSMADYKKEDWLLNLPLWSIETLPMDDHSSAGEKIGPTT